MTLQDASMLVGSQLSLSVAKLLDGSTNLFHIIPTEMMQAGPQVMVLPHVPPPVG